MRVAGLVIVAALLLAGCSSAEPESPDETADGTAAVDEDAADAEGTADAQDTEDAPDTGDTAPPAGDATADAAEAEAGETATHGEPLAVLEGPLDGAVRAEIRRLQRTGATVELSVLIRNGNPDEGWGAGWGRHDNFLSGGLEDDDPASDSIAGVALIDGVNGKRHYPLRDPDGRCACSAGMLATPPGESLALFASYPSPPEDVEVMSVQIPEFGSIEVPLQ